ncbi:hypothetical protein [Mycobacterium sp. E3339]|uniref:hypothetical protein n=1 Tax=Mycobacterium sp. E3339 TaxID=1834146 RepID=UPI0007FDB815|nr:hypothetical protein [Mycobacterium sp. E3339]OBG69483.1 hypothetical protein A5702_12475 [Mycobacterium sp. E3339]
MSDNSGSAMTKAERDQLVKVARLRAKQAEREAEARQATLLAEVQDQLTAEFDAHDKLWSDAVTVAEEALDKTNAQIRLQCAELGIPAVEAPQLVMGWRSRGPSYSNRNRRAELRKLAETRLAALTKTAKVAIRDNLLDVETELIAGDLQSADARKFLASLPTAEELMPALRIEDLGVVRWQPPEDAATQLTTPLTPADRRRRRILRAIEANPTASDRKVAEIAGVDHKTVAAHRRGRGESPATGGELPTAEAD